MYAIGIDIGTTNCKICLYRISDLALINKYSFPTPKKITEYGSDFDISPLWDGILHGLTLAAHQVNDPQNIAAISVASVGEAGVLLDAQDRIIGPVLTWYDTRSQPQLEKVIERLGEKQLYEITGIPAHSNYSLNKILWLSEQPGHQPPARWLCLAEYIAFRLSGVKKAEYSLASRTLAFNINTANWSEAICRAMELPQGLFSPLVNAGEPTGDLLPSLRQITGIPAQAKISIAGHDHMCGSVAVGITDETQILNSTGTTEGLLMVSQRLAVSSAYQEARVSNGVHVLPERYSLYASLPAAGYAIEWFCQLFGLSSADFSQMADSLTHSSAANKPDSSFLIPHLRGSGPPKRTIFAKGLLYGIGERSEPETLLRALFHGLCFELRLLLETYEKLTDRRWASVLVTGAACRNPYWLQLKANILNREIIACAVSEAVSLGAAIIGARGAGYQPAVSPLIEKGQRRYQPVSTSAAHFQQIYEDIYKPLYDRKMQIENQLSRTPL